MAYWLYENLKSQIDDYPNPEFAFKGSINWIRSLAILSSSSELNHENIKEFYSELPKKDPYSEKDIIQSMENILLAIHNYISIKKMCEIDNPMTVIRSAIISWYYCIYNVTKAMNLSISGQNSDTHSKTAKIFQSSIIRHSLIPEPFSINIDSLCKNNIDGISSQYSSTESFQNNWYPKTQEEALISYWSYVKGTANFHREITENQIKNKNKDFLRAGFTNFRKNEAKGIRDSILEKKNINFLSMAFRYRGKANYRDSLYLSYDCREMILSDYYETIYDRYLPDLLLISKKYLEIGITLLERRSKKSTWGHFKQDVEENNVIDFSFMEIEHA